MLDLKLIFDKHEDEYIKFEKVKDKLNNRPDLCAFILLDNLIPGDDDIISASEHDEFYLDIDCDKLAEIISEEDIITLIRCGIRYHSEYNCLYMFA